MLTAFILSFFNPACSQDMELPDQPDTISDQYNMVRQEHKQEIIALAQDLKRITSVKLTVAVVQLTKPADAATYGKALYDRWDVGQKSKGLDHGVLLLIAVLDREVKIISSEKLDMILTPEIINTIEISLYPAMGEGKISEAAYQGAAAITKLIIEEWPRYLKEEKTDPRVVSMIIFSLLVSAILLTLIFGGTFLTAFGTIVGGLFGYLLGGILGLIIGATIGFVVNLFGTRQKESKAEKEFRAIYERWKARQRGRRNRNEDQG